MNLFYRSLLSFAVTTNVALASTPAEDAWVVKVHIGETDREMYLLPDGEIVDFEDKVFGKWTKITSPKGTYWLLEGDDDQIYVAGEVGRKWKGAFWKNYETKAVPCEYEITPPTFGRDSTPPDVDVSYWLVGGVVDHFFARGIGDLQLRGGGITRVNEKQSRFYSWSAHLNHEDKLFLVAKTSKGRRFYWKRKTSKMFHGVNFGDEDITAFFAKLNWPGDGLPRDFEEMEVVEVKGLLKAQPRAQEETATGRSESSREIKASATSEAMFQDGWRFGAVGHRWGGPRFLSPDGVISRGNETVAGSWSQINDRFVVMNFSASKEVYIAWKGNAISADWQGMYLTRSQGGVETGKCLFSVRMPADKSLEPIPDEDISDDFVGLTQISSTGERLFLQAHGQLFSGGRRLGEWSARRDQHGDTYLVLVSNGNSQLYWKTGTSWSGVGYDGGAISPLAAKLKEVTEEPPKTNIFAEPASTADALRKRGPDSGAAYVWPDLAGVAGSQKPWSLARDFKSYLGRDFAPWGSYAFNGTKQSGKEVTIYSPDLSTVFFIWQQNSSWRGILKDRGGIRVIGDVVFQDNGRLHGASSPADASFAGKSLICNDIAVQWNGPSRLAADGCIYNQQGQRRGDWAAIRGPDGKTFLSLHFVFSGQHFVLWQKGGQWTGVWEWRNIGGSVKQMQLVN